MKFLRESAVGGEIKLIEEEASGGAKDLFIEGIFAQAEEKNRNGRIYPKKIMESAVNRYVDEFVKTNRALGELSHPENRPTVKPELACHRIVEFRMDGNNVFGKAKVLNTPQGQIVKGLLEGGCQLGVSTRGLGSTTQRAGATYVGEDFTLMAVDVVSDPSGIDCWVNAVNESQEWLITDDGRVVESIKKELKKQRMTEERALQLFSRFMQEIK